MWLQVKESLGHQQLEAAGRVFLEEVVFVFSRLLRVVAPQDWESINLGLRCLACSSLLYTRTLAHEAVSLSLHKRFGCVSLKRFRETGL